MAASKKSGKKSAKKSSKKSSKKARGSQKLAAARAVTATSSSGGTGVLGKSLAAINRSRLNHDIIIRGIPIPDIITGTLRARNVRELTTGLTALFAIQGIEYKPIRLFPKGIPGIDIIEAQIEGRLRRK